MKIKLTLRGRAREDIDLLVTDSPLPTAIATPLATLGTEVVTP